MACVLAVVLTVAFDYLLRFLSKVIYVNIAFSSIPMADDKIKKQRICLDILFLLGKTAAEAVNMPEQAFQERALKKMPSYEW